MIKSLNWNDFYNFRSNCTDGYLKIYLKGQETQDAYDKFDYELCGTEIPHLITSDGPRLAMVFSAGELQAKGFKVIFRYIVWVANKNVKMECS